MFLITIGIVYGDIGTSPLYVMKSIIEGNGGVSEVNSEFIIGSLSLIIWTVTLLTTIKYVLIAMKADNHGEGGIFSLYTLVHRCGKWLVFPAMLGGAALLADGVLTPAVTVTTAVEGLRSIPLMERLLGAGQAKVILITLLIITVLFAAQSAGTGKIGRAFGPCMLVWFLFLGLTGLFNMSADWNVLRAFNPVRAVRLLLSPYNKKGFMILGSIFLAATGAEALYSDMGHVGRENIYFSWPFVKICLILNYLGQGAWIIQSGAGCVTAGELNPFFMMLPEVLRPLAVLLSAMAAVIASQALISGSYTLVSEAIQLDLMPHLKVQFPSETKGQIFIPAINLLMWICCSAVVLYFRSSEKIEAAYGLAITATMLMTTLLLSVYLRHNRNRPILSVVILLVFGAIEAVFFISSLSKFTIGGYVTVAIALLIFFVMLVWHRGTALEAEHAVRLYLPDFVERLRKLHDDDSVSETCPNLVYVENGTKDDDTVDRDILYSILDKSPKKAKAYWLISVNVDDEPYTREYEVDTYGTDFLYRVRLNLGFKEPQRVNMYLRQIVGDLMASGELPLQPRDYSIYGSTDVGSFKFCLMKKAVQASPELSKYDFFLLKAKYAIRTLAGNRVKWYGLDTSSLIVESVPLIIRSDAKAEELIRIKS